MEPLSLFFVHCSWRLRPELTQMLDDGWMPDSSVSSATFDHPGFGPDRRAPPPDHERDAMSEYQFVAYETLDDGRIVRIMLNRPEARNAQNRGMLVELNEAFLRAEADDEVRVVILGGAGPLFSAGHDMGSQQMMDEVLPGPKQ